MILTILLFCFNNGDAGVLQCLARFSLEGFFSFFISIDYSRYVQRCVIQFKLTELMNQFGTGSVTFSSCERLFRPILSKRSLWFVYRFSPVSSYFNDGKSKYYVVVVFVLLFSVGVRALKFLQGPPQLQASYLGWSVDYNCTTDDPNATVSLLYSRDFGFSYNVFPVTPNRLILRKQVFTLVNVILSDGGYYKCKATDQSGLTIEWKSGSMLFVQAGLYEYFEYSKLLLSSAFP